MEKLKLVPFLRPNLDILFVGLNPAKGSNDNGHYFSVNQAFWNQLYEAELILKPVNKLVADNLIFGNNHLNFDNWQYGIIDLVTTIAESDSTKINPSYKDCICLLSDIEKFKPKTVVILHGKVLSKLFDFLGSVAPKANTGKLGQLINKSTTEFFNIAFPHGNSINSVDKIMRYKELKKEILKIKNDNK